eukprot:TRINITY_DN4480_c0_g2_i2.p1 TRINITY_DN4480_c0_g2~~TRINITY_DN4480_c0_g2_i2.p1  ORF type:complete len:195 (+),score=40.30 TRINITY_DN4480_c0_g2_i2:63-587(+)
MCIRDRVWLVSKVLNWFRSKNKISTRTQFVLWFSGFRGAMAFALSISCASMIETNGPVMLTLSLVIASSYIIGYSPFLTTLLERYGHEQPIETSAGNSPTIPDPLSIPTQPTGIWDRIRARVEYYEEKYIIRNVRAKSLSPKKGMDRIEEGSAMKQGKLDNEPSNDEADEVDFR